MFFPPNEKYVQMLTLLKTLKKELFAINPNYVIFCVEFQKRGLPHAHILIKFPRECVAPEDIDKVISAELPTNPSDKELVIKFMMHNHPTNGRIPRYCRKRDGDTTCRFRYPQEVNQRTYINDRGRVVYRRRTENDRMVVPYNLELLRRFQCHINFEIAGSSQLYQYLFKYIHKGQSPHFSIFMFRLKFSIQDQIIREPEL
jgi:hypothetical protein